MMLGKEERGDEKRFTGIVQFQRLQPEPIRPAKVGPIRMLRSSFERGSRSYWHTHPSGQIMYFESGRGRVGWKDASGKTKAEEVEAGVIVIVEPNEKHWHGATSDREIVSIDIHANSSYNENEQVSEEEYKT